MCGIATESCVLATALGGFEADLTPWLIEDASASHAGQHVHEAGILVTQRFIGQRQIIKIADIPHEFSSRTAIAAVLERFRRLRDSRSWPGYAQVVPEPIDSDSSADRGYLDEFGDLETAIKLIRSIKRTDEPRVNGDHEAFVELVSVGMGDAQRIRDVGVACMTLVDMLRVLLDDNPFDFIPAAIRKIRAMEGVPDEVLPDVAGGLTAAFLKMPCRVWREARGPIPQREFLAWTYAAWFLADFIDFAADERGYALNAVERLMARVLEQNLDDPGDSY
ncbi:hypothetical protein GCM10010149_68590 [Nonomuraea roseoviolacea subsp. roseoviolacea]